MLRASFGAGSVFPVWRLLRRLSGLVYFIHSDSGILPCVNAAEVHQLITGWAFYSRSPRDTVGPLCIMQSSILSECFQCHYSDFDVISCFCIDFAFLFLGDWQWEGEDRVTE
uniref:Uncharacterized protein n=1 Tax=Anguilla anguilla TaxID=7936 RepID=A0A0E9WBQ9_ANGAN